jgi:hypothetical protein
LAAFTSPVRAAVFIRVVAVCAWHDNSAGFLAGLEGIHPQNAKTRRRIEAAVIGWREPKRNQR